MAARLANHQRLSAANQDHGLGQSRMGTIESYDPSTNTVRVMIQPDGTMTGWIPIGGIGAGNGIGVVIGPLIGEQVKLDPVEGSAEDWCVSARVFSAVDMPPVSTATKAAIQSGEVGVFAQGGTFIHATAAGDLYAASGRDAIVTAARDVHVTGAQNVEVTAQGQIKLTAPAILMGS